MVFEACPRPCYKVDSRTTGKALLYLQPVSMSILMPVSHRATILLSLISTGLMFSNNVSGAYGALLGPAHTAMSSAMACRVYRTVLLLSDDGNNNLDTPQISRAFRAVTAEEFPLSAAVNLSRRKDNLRQETIHVTGGD